MVQLLLVLHRPLHWWSDNDEGDDDDDGDDDTGLMLLAFFVSILIGIPLDNDEPLSILSIYDEPFDEAVNRRRKKGQKDDVVRQMIPAWLLTFLKISFITSLPLDFLLIP